MSAIEKQLWLFIVIIPSELHLELAFAVIEGMPEVSRLSHVVPLLQQFVAQKDPHDLRAPLLLKSDWRLDALHKGLVRLAPTQIKNVINLPSERSNRLVGIIVNIKNS